MNMTQKFQQTMTHHLPPACFCGLPFFRVKDSLSRFHRLVFSSCLVCGMCRTTRKQHKKKKRKKGVNQAT